MMQRHVESAKTGWFGPGMSLPCAIAIGVLFENRNRPMPVDTDCRILFWNPNLFPNAPTGPRAGRGLARMIQVGCVKPFWR
jgi:hypothetical protein